MTGFWRSRKVAWLAVLLTFALVAAACGGDDEAEDTTEPPTEETEPPTEETEPPTEETEPPTEETEPPEEEVDVPTELAGLTLVDDRTFTVELTVADPEFPLQLSYNPFFPLPPGALEDPAGFEESPIGNGPFMMDGVWERSVRVPTVAYPDYAGENTPQLDSIEFAIYADTNTAYLDVQAGNLDFLKVVPTDFAGSYEADFPDRNDEFFDTSFNYLGFPAYLDQFTQEHRQAMSMAIDRELIAEQIFEGTRDPANSVIPPVLFGREEVCDSWNYDPAAAATLWDAAGDPGPITVWFNSGAGHEAWVEAVVNMWGQNLGLDTGTVTFEGIDFAELLPIRDAGELTGPYRAGWGQDYPSPYNFLFPLYHSNSFPPAGANDLFYSNPDFDAALADGQAAFAASGDIDDALPFYYEAEDILCEDAQTAPIFFGKTQSVWAEGIDNVVVDSYRDLDYTRVTSDDGSLSHQISEPERLWPPDSNESEGTAVLKSLFTPLVQFDAETSEMFLAQAESIESDDGGQTWTIVIKDGWSFHNGEPVTAQGYVDAWNHTALGANGEQNNSFFANFVGYDEMNPPSDDEDDDEG